MLRKIPTRKGKTLQTLSRLYSTPGQATGAVNQLIYSRFSAETIFVIGPPGGRGAGALPEGVSTDDIATAIMKGYILKSDARIYAEGVAGGGTLVIVHAPFGTALEATEILGSFSPTHAGVAEPKYPSRPWDDAAPLSSALHMPVLTSNWRLPDLSASTFTVFNIPALTNNKPPYRGLLGLPLLTRHRRRSTGFLGLPLLTRNRMKPTGFLGLPLLTKSRQGPTGFLGLPLLASNPAILSSLLHLPVLCRE
jgi:hypothetical protein